MITIIMIKNDIIQVREGGKKIDIKKIMEIIKIIKMKKK